MIVKLPAAGTGEVDLRFTQGAGDGTTDNQSFVVGYNAGAGYFHILNRQLGADNIRLLDGDAQVLGNTTNSQFTAFDEYDDAMVLWRAFSPDSPLRDGTYTVGQSLLSAARRELIEMGVLRQFSDGWVGSNADRWAGLLAGGIYQNRFRMDDQFATVDDRLAAIERDLMGGK
jgi:hypothetical protein